MMGNLVFQILILIFIYWSSVQDKITYIITLIAMNYIDFPVK